MQAIAYSPQDPNSLSPAERGVLAAYWRSRGEGEMGAELYFRRTIEDLKVLDAAPALLNLAERACRDERKHGLWGRDWAVFFGHADQSEPVARRTRPLEFAGAGERDNRILRLAFAAFTETAGCHVLSDVRPRIIFAPLRQNNQQHLSDEVVHARLCWGFLSGLGQRDRAMLQRFLPILLRALPCAVCDGPESDEHDRLVPFGYLTPRVLRDAYQRAIREVIGPGLQYLGLVSRGVAGELNKGVAA